MKKLKLYIETSVWGFLFADDALEKKAATELFFNEIEYGNYEIFVSETVNEEIRFAPGAKREILFELIRKYDPVLLEKDEEVQYLAEMYVKNGVLTEKHFNDLLHLAYSSIYGMNALISWNLTHIVKMGTQDLCNSTNLALGYHTIQVRTPQEVVKVEKN